MGYSSCECGHQDTKIARVVLSNQSESVWEICQHCFGTIRVLKKSDVAEVFDRLPMIPHRDLRAARDQWSENKYRQERQREREEWFKWYDEYLNTEKWKMLRKKVIMRSGGLCEGCRERPVESVHHLTYAHVGQEFCFELVALCQDCHDRVHTDKDGQEASGPHLAEMPT